MLPGLLVFLIILAPAGLAAAPDAPGAVPQVRVPGIGSVWARPDLAVLLFTVEAEAPRAPEAVAAAARQADTFLAAVKKLLPAPEAVHSLSFRVDPVYTPPDKGRQPKVAAYRARHTYRVRLGDIALVGPVIDAGLAQGATQVQGPRWEHSNAPELQRRAAVQALEQARKMAEALAGAEKLQIKRLLQVSTHAAVPAPPPGLARALAPEAAATPIEVGEEEIRASVEAVFELQ